jgi:hypothetical protein
LRLPPAPRARLLATLLLATTTSVACRDAATAFGPSPATAAANARDVFAAMAMRFTNVQRAPRFARARGKLGRYALTPSKIYDDTSIWLPAATGAGDVRALTLEGSFAGGRYVFVPRAEVPLPSRLGESRHAMRLRRIGDNEYEWATAVDQGVGTGLRAAQLEDVYGALLASAVRHGGDGAVRADYRAAFPRTAAALGQLFSLDGVRTTPAADGSAAVLVTVRLHPERLHARYPAFEQYVTKYVVPSRYHLTLRDGLRARWFDAAADRGVLTVLLRATPDGRMAPLDGPARAMPDSLTLTADFSTHILVFDVGVSDLKAAFVVRRTAHERGWQMRFATEPDWHLPLATRYLIRAPLRRPFANGGTTLLVTARDSAGAQTLLSRRLTMAVQESAILRFLGALGFTAMSDFAGQSETEENRFLADAFAAMRADAESLGAGAAAANAGTANAGTAAPGDAAPPHR